jgi:hypothetical protein
MEQSMRKYYIFFAGLWLLLGALAIFQTAMTKVRDTDEATSAKIKQTLCEVKDSGYDYCSYKETKHSSEVRTVEYSQEKHNIIACAVFRLRLHPDYPNGNISNITDQSTVDKATELFNKKPAKFTKVSSYYDTVLAPREPGINCYMLEYQDLQELSDAKMRSSPSQNSPVCDYYLTYDYPSPLRGYVYKQTTPLNIDGKTYLLASQAGSTEIPPYYYYGQPPVFSADCSKISLTDIQAGDTLTLVTAGGGDEIIAIQRTSR